MFMDGRAVFGRGSGDMCCIILNQLEFMDELAGINQKKIKLAIINTSSIKSMDKSSVGCEMVDDG